MVHKESRFAKETPLDNSQIRRREAFRNKDLKSDQIENEEASKSANINTTKQLITYIVKETNQFKLYINNDWLILYLSYLTVNC
jgi:hypothetical protein